MTMASKTLGENVSSSRNVRLDGGIQVSPEFFLRWNGVITNNLLGMHSHGRSYVTVYQMVDRTDLFERSQQSYTPGIRATDDSL